MSSSIGSLESCRGIIEKHWDLSKVLDFVNVSDNFNTEERFYIEKHVREKLISHLSLGTSVIRAS